MTIFADVECSSGDLTRVELEACYARTLVNPFSINMTRGLPSSEQLALATDFLFLPGRASFISRNGVDWRNYGCLQGLPEVRALFSETLLGLPTDQVVIAENSSLALMYEALGYAFRYGVPCQNEPWSQVATPKFLCPVPGYDRHFAICDAYQIEMVPVPMLDTGPDMDIVERLVLADPSIKGMWCVPKYNNPCGSTYSPDTVQRLASMPTGALDFVLFWDNAYAVHHLTDDEVPNQPIAQLCEAAGYANRVFIFASTSKIVLPSAGLAFFGASPANIEWFLRHRKSRTIGPDKANQLRHLVFFGDRQGVVAHMRKHRVLLEPKFKRLEDVLSGGLSGVESVTWTRPKGGYFVSLNLPQGCASRVVELALAAGLALTPAGATYPGGIDPYDRNIRLAPTYLDIETLGVAAQILVLCVLLTLAEKNISQF